MAGRVCLCGFRRTDLSLLFIPYSLSAKHLHVASKNANASIPKTATCPVTFFGSLCLAGGGGGAAGAALSGRWDDGREGLVRRGGPGCATNFSWWSPGSVT